MNKKGFTLVELLGVVVILSIILIIAIPNITSVMERSKRDNYIADAKKLITLVEYEIRKGTVNKPSSTEIYAITLGYLKTMDLNGSLSGKEYDKDESYVIIARKNDYLTYYVNLVEKDEDNEYTGIILASSEELDGNDRYKTYQSNESTVPSNDEIKQKVGINATPKFFK